MKSQGLYNPGFVTFGGSSTGPRTGKKTFRSDGTSKDECFSLAFNG